MPIYGYGEDGLTYWVLTDRLADVLSLLDDDTPLDRTCLFFRPSFGRSGGDKSPQFGEFDAILATPKAVYLIESKWDGMSRSPRQAVVLEDVQLVRHQIFTWLRAEWARCAAADWQTFRGRVEADFTANFPNRPLAGAERLLSCNLSFVLPKLAEYSAETVNVLLYFTRAGVVRPNRIVNSMAMPVTIPAFRLCCLEYVNLSPSGYFEIKP